MQGKIVGAGIGGLVTALAIQQRNMNVSVYEASNDIRPAGAGIILAINAMRVMEKLGLADAILQLGNELQAVHITDESLHPLSQNILPHFTHKYGLTNVSIIRSELQDILLDKLKPGTLELGKKCIRVVEKERKGILHFEDDSEAYGDYVIAADGIHSRLRQQLFPDAEVRDVKQICWRGLAAFDLPAKYHKQAIEAWGRGKRFGFSKLNDDFIYWFAVINKHDNDFNYGGDLREELQKQFRDFDPLIGQMVMETPPSRVFRNDLMDLKPLSQWYRGRTCLLGDAAHAVTPNLGQGACQGVEDAWVLASLLEASKNPDYAFSEYQKLRKPVTDYVAKWSWRVGEMAHLENAFLTWSRNEAVKRVPLSFMKKRMDRLFAPTYDI